MKKLLLMGLLFGAIQVIAQQHRVLTKSPISISPSDSMRWANTPQLKLDIKNGTKTLLPKRVDNSEKKYFPNIEIQHIPNCGQHSGVRYTLSYELNRLLNRTAKSQSNVFSSTFNGITTSHGDAENTLKTWDNMKSIGCLFESDLSNEMGESLVTDYLDYRIPINSFYLNGYNWYYKAMQNKVDDYAAISLDSEEGILTMKHWVHNHLEEDSVGGVGVIYLGMSTIYPLSSGYDIGKYVIPEFYYWVSHGLTIVGYDDRIEYDFNEDGQITNDVDITGDGIVDVRDWEKGAAIIANSYGADWANNGTVYVMYRTLALSPSEGGIWNKTMYVVRPKLPVKPKVTYRFTIEHQNKSKIAVYAGVSQNPNSTYPDFVVEVPFLKYNSYSSSISGDTLGLSSPVEFGFDATPMLNKINNGSVARFFLQVVELDGENKFSGSIKSFSVIDYSHGANEVIANSQPVSLVNNGLTTLFVNVCPEFSKPQLNQTQPPKVKVNQPYQYQLTASKGTPPYRFIQTEGYQVSTRAHALSVEDGFVELIFPTGSKASVKVATQIPIQVYDSIHDEDVFINPHGYIQLHNYDYFWPFNNMDYTLLKGHTTIAPLMSNFVFDKPGFGVWYKSTPESLSVHWRCRFETDTASILDFSANIYKNGDVKFEYDTIKYVSFNSWVRGISKGNGVDITKFGSDYSISPNTDYLFDKITTDTSINLNRNGLVLFMPDVSFTNKTLNITVLDNNDLESKGTITLSSTKGADIEIIGYNLNGNTKEWFSPQDTISASITIRNNSNNIKREVKLTTTASNPFLDFIKSTIIIPEISANQEITIPNAFVFKPNSMLESELFELLNVSTQNNESIGVLNVNLTPIIPLEVGNFIIDSTSANIIHSNSNHTILIPFRNLNRFPIGPLNATFTSSSPEIVVHNGTLLIDSIASYTSDTLKFQINTLDLNSQNLLVTFNGKIFNNQGVNAPFVKTYSFSANKTENYENEQHPFIFNSDLSDTLPIRIANIGCNSDKSWLVCRPANTNIKYSLKRSFSIYSPTNSTIEFDYISKHKLIPSLKRLTYSIDNISYSLDSSNSWKHVKIPISSGKHSFIFDFLAQFASDSIFIDNFSIPDYNLESLKYYQISPSEVRLKCRPDTMVGFTLEPTGFGYPITTLDYQIVPSAYQKCDWLSQNGVMVLNENQTQPLSYYANTSGLAPGNYTSYIRFYDQQFYTPVKVSLEVIDGYQPPSDGSILVYPNPASDKITFDFISTDETSAELTIYDVMGREAFSKEQTIDFGTDLKFVTFDISEVSLGNSTKGLYLYRLKVGKDIYNGKITITH